MRLARLSILVLGSVLVLAACGRVPATSSPAETPSPSPLESPTATATASPLTIPGPSLHTGEVGLAYTPMTYQASGGNAPYIWNVSDGALPVGLSLSLDGTISGTPSAGGKFTFTVEVMDASLATTHLGGTIDIAPKLYVRYTGDSASVDSNTGIPIVNVCIGSRADHPCPATDIIPVTFGKAAGGVPPYTYRVSSGGLPSSYGYTVVELTVRSHSVSPCPTALSAGGCPLPFGLYRVAVEVMDSMGAKSTIVVEVWLYWT